MHEMASHSLVSLTLVVLAVVRIKRRALNFYSPSETIIWEAGSLSILGYRVGQHVTCELHFVLTYPVSASREHKGSHTSSAAKIV